MLNINGHRYAKNDGEFINTLFSPDGTANGYYKKRRTGVLLLDMQKVPRVFVKSTHNGAFMVSCAASPSGIRYMHGLCSTDESWIGVAGMSYVQENECARAIVDSIATK